MFECYENIVGFTNYDCSCTAEDRPDYYNTSLSGLFVDSIAEINDLIHLGKCDKNMWDLLEETRDSAITSFVSDSNALLGRKYKLKRKLSKDQIIGQIKSKEIYISSKNYAAVRIACAPVRSGYMKLKSVGGVFAQAGKNIPFTIVNSLGDLIYSASFTTAYKKYSSIDVNLSLPLYSKYQQPLEYYIYYPFSASYDPMNTKVDCGCGSFDISYNSSFPTYEKKSRGKWTDFLMVGGLELDTLSELDDLPNTVSDNMFGLVLDIGFTCKVNEVICKDSLDFVGNPLALSVAYAIQHKWAAYIARDILSSKMMTWENLVGREIWEELEISSIEKYNENINYIVDTLDHTGNDCLECREILEITRAGIFS